ncbi:MAG TPA: extracellular solute-binding protein [Thermoleophilia bacterium]|nr:extracellular solute-binding protein [Thermoleophilia bacterium]
MRLITRIGALVAVLALFVAACGGEGDSPASAPGTQAPADESPALGATPDDPAETTANDEPVDGDVAASCGGSQEWDALVAAAQEEGEVVLNGPATAAVRETLPPAFEEEFGIQMSYDGGRSSEVASRMTAERAAGIHSTDVFLGGAGTMYRTFYGEGMIADLRQLLVGDEIYQDENWAVGSVPFQDPEETYILRISDYESPAVMVNTDSEASDVTTWQELLEPSLKGQIVILDPRESGGGNNASALLMETFGEEFVRELYVGQEPTIVTDDRQAVDDLARGRYSVGIALQNQQGDEAIEQGLPIAYVSPTDAPAPRTAGYGLMAVSEPAAHPNAAALLANWLACPEGNKLWTESQNYPSARADVELEDPPPYVAERVIEPGREYFDNFGYEFRTTTFLEVEEYMIELLGER